MRTNLLFMAAAIPVACAADDDPATTGAAVESTGADEESTGAPAESSGTAPQGSSSSAGDESTSIDPSTSTTGDDSTGATDESTSGDPDTGDKPSPECVQYCDEFMPNCNELADIEAYDDLPDCLQSCEPFSHGPVGAFDGDTVECRIAHLTFDPTPDPGYYELHCFHAQEHPTAQCV